MKKIILFLIIIFINFSCHVTPVSRIPFDKIKGPFSRKDLTETPAENENIVNSTDIHYSVKYCSECHIRIPTNKKDDSTFLKFDGDFKQLCKCHYETQARDAHPVDIAPSVEMKVRIPDEFPLANGNLSCDTCHDVSIQCQDIQDPYERQKNFLRGSQSRNTVDFCFRCHDIKKFQRYDPHRQIDDNGEIIQETCLYCHSEVPDIKEINRQNSYLIGGSTAMCIGCHNPIDKMSLHYRHVIRPSASVLERIKQMEKDYNIILPLSDTGMVTCITCHDPHQEGLISGYRSGAIDPKEEKKNQFSGSLCDKCHEIK